LSKEISLVIKDEKIKQEYFNILVDKVKIPICKNCGKLFGLGFPSNDTGISDRLICEENYLVCECEYATIVKKLYSAEKDGVIDVSVYYQ